MKIKVEVPADRNGGGGGFAVMQRSVLDRSCQCGAVRTSLAPVKNEHLAATCGRCGTSIFGTSTR